MGLIDDALARQAAAPPPRRIDYDRMNRVLPAQKAQLTRVRRAAERAYAAWRERDSDENIANLETARENLARVIKTHVEVWNEIGAWPDQWHTWQVALDDALPYFEHIDIGDL